MKTHLPHFPYLFGVACLLLFAGSCRKDLPAPDPTTPDRPEEQADGLGEKLENPHSI